ncbi:MAG: LysR family transcriptional regulator [Robiginitomaculum sp.]|nr:LysR family transcriptional regulator [Robiginitomaculum sp.]
MLDLKDLEYVSAISKAGGIKRAADRIGISQPALTNRVKNLEEKLQLQLFNRHSKGMRLTQAGELFLTESQKLLAHTRDFEQRLSNHRFGKHGHISVGVKPGLEDAFFRSGLIEYTNSYPKTKISIVVDSTPELSSKLQDGKLDFAFGALGYADEHGEELILSERLEFRPLFRIPLEVYVRKGHPILKEPKSKNGLFNYPMVSPTPPVDMRAKLKEAYCKSGLNISTPHILVDDFAIAADVVAKTDMWSVVFCSSAQALSDKGSFTLLGQNPALPPLQIGLVKRKTWSITPCAKNFIDVMITHATKWKI